MSKAFTKENPDAPDDDDEVLLPALPAGTRNYMTPGGHGRLKAELEHLTTVDRPEVTRIVSWAASNGDRSENGDYLYGKRRLREIDRRTRYLIKRLDAAEVIDPATRDTDQVFFGATVTVTNQRGETRTIAIVGLDEVDPARGYVSWISPIARALTKSREGDTVAMPTPSGVEELEILAVEYRTLDTHLAPSHTRLGVDDSSPAPSAA
ncbi:MAG: transcription elongation factor GreB [Burkholderiales bacterium]|nr:transcription elongation factor GreB [Burkholderiales bacterium]